MALMYDMETVNKAMTEAAKLYDPKQKSIRVKRVLDIFAGMKPVQAVQVIRCRECKHNRNRGCPMRTLSLMAGGRLQVVDNSADNGFCHMGEKMDGGAEDVQTY